MLRGVVRAILKDRNPLKKALKRIGLCREIILLSKYMLSAASPTVLPSVPARSHEHDGGHT